jgi:hypothetical protein
MVTTRAEAAQYLKDAGGLKLVVFGADGREVAAMFVQGSVSYDEEEATFIAVAEDGHTAWGTVCGRNGRLRREHRRLCHPYRAIAAAARSGSITRRKIRRYVVPPHGFSSCDTADLYAESDVTTRCNSPKSMTRTEIPIMRRGRSFYAAGPH